MSDASNVAKNLRERLSVSTEDRLGKALGELLESPLLTGAIGKAFDAREKAAQAQEVALGALNLPSAADIERLTRRLRSVSQRLEGIEDGVGHLDRVLSPNAPQEAEITRRLEAIEAQLARLSERLDRAPATPAGTPYAAIRGGSSPKGARRGPRKGAGKPKAAKPNAAKPKAAKPKAAKPAAKRVAKPGAGQAATPKSA
jgi:hypothetical protein